LKAGFSQSAIAFEIGVHKSTVSREINRNKGLRGYRPKQAHALAVYRRNQAAKYLKMTPSVVAMIDFYIRQEFSPEQIAGYLKRTKNIRISHESIYRHVLIDKINGGTLYRHLRRSQRKRKKRYGSKNIRGHIPGRVSIDDRPDIVDAKNRIGDWEIDTVIGENHKGALLTIVERKSKFTLIKKLFNKQADHVADSTVRLLSPYHKKVFTITSDNGKEFAKHDRISKKLRANVYFAHPYHAWERGLNENTNGLIRQYFPKKTNFEKVKDESIQFVIDRLNNRPRKSLGFATPNEVFFGNYINQAA
jgi:IS30 family transposase